MAAALWTYTLPTLQLVCHLVPTENTSIGETIPGTIEPPSTTLSPSSLRTGYVAYPDLGFAYKVYDEIVTWDEAKDRCAREGAYLAAIDSTMKMNVVMNQRKLTEHIHLGFYLEDDDDSNWYSLYTGLPVSNLPWASGEPNGDGRCIMLIIHGLYGLGKYSCTRPGHYVCQIQYP